MDPLALAAVVGLVFAGKRLSDGQEETTTSRPPLPTTRPITRRDLDLTHIPKGDNYKDLFDMNIQTPDLGRRLGDWRLQPKEAVANMGDVVPNGNRFPFGQPVYDLYNRQYVTNKMNNLQPIERRRVGPGLGVGPDVASAGGFHQYFRVLPTNINEERLTTLEGRTGPADAFVKSGGAGGLGEVTHEAKESKAWYRAPAQNRGQGQGGPITGAEGRPEYLKTQRPTIRDEQTTRSDTLSMGPAQYSVYQPYASGGETCYTDKTLTRASGNRVNPDRAGNAGGMNVREDPLNQGGVMTNLRGESSPFPVQHGDAGRFQNYIVPQFHKFDEKKGNPNPLATPKCMDVAIQQLDNNPIALPPLATV
jgi:hypothetical protein